MARERGTPDPASPESECAGQDGVALSIHRSRLLRYAGGALLAGALAHAGWLQSRGAPLPAAVVLLGVCAFARGLWQLRHAAGAMPMTLSLLPDGWVVLHADDDRVEAHPSPCSLRLGRYILLVLHARGGRRLRLLLGPGNLSASDLAALGRWLQRAPAGGETEPEVLR